MDELFGGVEDRWEAGSQGLMRLMEFGCEALARADVSLGSSALECAKHVHDAALYVRAGAALMRQLGTDVSPEEYADFRRSRDVGGSATDARIVEVHRWQKAAMDGLFRRVRAAWGADPARAPHAALARALLELNEAHHVVFASHRFVCQRLVPQGERSLRGGDIAALHNNDLAQFVADLRREVADRS